VSFELLSKGRKLAQNFSGILKAVLIGHQVKSLAAEAFHYGAQEIFLVRIQSWDTIRPCLTAGSLTSWWSISATYHAIWRYLYRAGPGTTGRFSYRSGLTADCTDLQISNVSYLRKDYPELLLQIRPAFAEISFATIISRISQPDGYRSRRGNGVITIDIPVKGKIIEIPFQPDPTETDKDNYRIRKIRRGEPERLFR